MDSKDINAPQMSLISIAMRNASDSVYRLDAAIKLGQDMYPAAEWRKLKRVRTELTLAAKHLADLRNSLASSHSEASARLALRTYRIERQRYKMGKRKHSIYSGYNVERDWLDEWVEIAECTHHDLRRTMDQCQEKYGYGHVRAIELEEGE